MWRVHACTLCWCSWTGLWRTWSQLPVKVCRPTWRAPSCKPPLWPCSAYSWMAGPTGLLYCAGLRRDVLRRAVLFCCWKTVYCCMGAPTAVLCCAALCCPGCLCTAERQASTGRLCCAVLYCTVLYCTVLCCVLLDEEGGGATGLLCCPTVYC